MAPHGKGALWAFIVVAFALSKPWQVAADDRDDANLGYLSRAADTQALHALTHGKLGGDRWQQMVKDGDMPKVTIQKKTWVPNKLASVPRGWRLGSAEMFHSSRDRFLDSASDSFDAHAAMERDATTSGLNRKAFVGGTVAKKYLAPGFLDVLKNMAGSWGGLVNGVASARVTTTKSTPHATRKKLGREGVSAQPRPVGG